MYEVSFFDMDDGFIRKVYVLNLVDVFYILKDINVDFENHFVKVRKVRFVK